MPLMVMLLSMCRVVHRGLVGESSQIWGEGSAGGPADGSRPEGSLLSGILEVIVQGPSRCDWGFRLFKWKAVGLPATELTYWAPFTCRLWTGIDSGSWWQW